MLVICTILFPLPHPPCVYHPATKRSVLVELSMVLNSSRLEFKKTRYDQTLEIFYLSFSRVQLSNLTFTQWGTNLHFPCSCTSVMLSVSLCFSLFYFLKTLMAALQRILSSLMSLTINRNTYKRNVQVGWKINLPRSIFRICFDSEFIFKSLSWSKSNVGEKSSTSHPFWKTTQLHPAVSFIYCASSDRPLMQPPISPLA